MFFIRSCETNEFVFYFGKLYAISCDSSFNISSIAQAKNLHELNFFRKIERNDFFFVLLYIYQFY